MVQSLVDLSGELPPLPLEGAVLGAAGSVTDLQPLQPTCVLLLLLQTTQGGRGAPLGQGISLQAWHFRSPGRASQ